MWLSAQISFPLSLKASLKHTHMQIAYKSAVFLFIAVVSKYLSIYRKL